MLHASQTARRTTPSSTQCKIILALALILLCIGAGTSTPALAAIYNSSVEENLGTAENTTPNDPTSGPVILQSLESPDTVLASISIAKNTPLNTPTLQDVFEASILASPEESFKDSAHSSQVQLMLSWDFSTLDTSSATLQEVTATATLPDGYLWKDGSQSLTFTKLVSVQEPNEPRLDVHNDSASAVFFPWVVPDSFTESDIHAFFAVDGEDFNTLETNDTGWVQNDGLALYATDLTDGVSYRIRIEYPGGYSETGFLYSSGNALIFDTVTGDRDGGDGEGNGPAQGEQPIPDTPPLDTAPPEQNEGSGNTNTEQPSDEEQDDASAGSNDTPLNPSVPAPPISLPNATNTDQAYAGTSSSLSANPSSLSAKQPAFERYSARETTISGTRLADLCAAGEAVFFDQNGIVISIPSTFLTSLGLRPSDTFSVYAMKTGSNRLTIALTVNDRLLPSAPGMLVRMPYEVREQETLINVLDESGTVVAQGSFVGTSLTFSVDKPGTFRIEENGTAATDKSTASSAEHHSAKETGVAYGADRSSIDDQVSNYAESPLLFALILCVMGVLSAAGGYGILVFLRKRF